MNTVFVHPLAGVLSAYGMGLADQGVMREAAVEQPLADAALPAVRARLDALADEATDEIRRQGAGSGEIRVMRRAHVRYAGTDSALVVDFGDGSVATLAAGFEAAYRRRYAFLMEGRGLIVEAVSVEAIAAGDAPAEPRVAAVAPTPAPVTETRAHVQRGPLVGRGAGGARDAAPGPPRRRPGHHRGEERDHRRRARLAGARDRARPPGAATHRAARARASRSAPASTR